MKRCASGRIAGRRQRPHNQTCGGKKKVVGTRRRRSHTANGVVTNSLSMSTTRSGRSSTTMRWQRRKRRSSSGTMRSPSATPTKAKSVVRTRTSTPALSISDPPMPIRRVAGAERRIARARCAALRSPETSQATRQIVRGGLSANHGSRSTADASHSRAPTAADITIASRRQGCRLLLQTAAARQPCSGRIGLYGGQQIDDRPRRVSSVSSDHAAAHRCGASARR